MSVGWSISSKIKAQLVCDALPMAIWRRQPKTGLVHPPDRDLNMPAKFSDGY
jgi:transposase InsO family protein